MVGVGDAVGVLVGVTVGSGVGVSGGVWVLVTDTGLITAVTVVTDWLSENASRESATQLMLFSNIRKNTIRFRVRMFLQKPSD